MNKNLVSELQTTLDGSVPKDYYFGQTKEVFERLHPEKSNNGLSTLENFLDSRCEEIQPSSQSRYQTATLNIVEESLDRVCAASEREDILIDPSVVPAERDALDILEDILDSNFVNEDKPSVTPVFPPTEGVAILEDVLDSNFVFDDDNVDFVDLLQMRQSKDSAYSSQNLIFQEAFLDSSFSFLSY